ncbi:hypothetical protein NADFUDRAFT_48236 [Nadsonia fulvescens var. elongata DSM 6958]|uniref:Uncharacterized protein n=1 Tax=Nadsonia fulvescens var. elongata DSM 6958 TaxID=857566 RepID=A0A1E3PDC2_9ASCO|nr:hypothetical protein NADFUDRAFT_48236 [Nadsonia fulvescens var. elongata DSM 6958]
MHRSRYPCPSQTASLIHSLGNWGYKQTRGTRGTSFKPEQALFIGRLSARRSGRCVIAVF